jgi:hypothetical protein
MEVNYVTNTESPCKIFQKMVLGFLALFKDTLVNIAYIGRVIVDDKFEEC